jgi:hypothetical protein
LRPCKISPAPSGISQSILICANLITLFDSNSGRQPITHIDVVQRYLDGWSRRDADAVLATLTADGTYEDPSSRGAVSGETFRG